MLTLFMLTFGQGVLCLKIAQAFPPAVAAGLIDRRDSQTVTDLYYRTLLASFKLQ